MDKYESYIVEDFLSDASFVAWVLVPTSELNQFWNSWIASHPERQTYVDRAKNILLSLEVRAASAALSDEEVSAIADTIQREVLARKVPIVTRLISAQWFKIAAVLLIALTASIIVFKNTRTLFQKADNQQLSVDTHVPQSSESITRSLIKYTNNDERAKLIRLSDGSLVILKPKSELQYPNEFEGTDRKVTLTGEAFFEVHKDPSRPFLVYSKHVITKVLGTSFTVRAFPGEEKFKVVVNTGRVQVYNQDQNSKTIAQVVLLPNQEVTITKNQTQLHKDVVAAPLLLSQQIATRVFSFNNAPLSDIIAKLEEAYKIQIIYDQEKFGKTTVTASLGMLPLDEKVKMICKAIDAQYDFNDGIITIK